LKSKSKYQLLQNNSKKRFQITISDQFISNLSQHRVPSKNDLPRGRITLRPPRFCADDYIDNKDDDDDDDVIQTEPCDDVTERC